MRKVIILPTTNNSKTIVVNSLDQLINTYKYIGFEETQGGERYFIVPSGTARGFAVNPDGTFSTKNEQMEIYKERYFVFDRIEELYNWLSKKN